MPTLLGVTRRQHGKGNKRLRGWHRGGALGRKAARRKPLPDVGSGADPTSGAPVVGNLGAGKLRLSHRDAL